MLDKQTRRSRHRPASTDEPITIVNHHLTWFEVLHRHGDLPTAYLYEFTKGTHRSYQHTQKTLRDLYHESNTQYPNHERIGRRVISRHPMPGVLCSACIYTRNPTTDAILKDTGLWRDAAPQKNLGQWQHDFFGSIIRATMHLAALRSGNGFHYHDEIVEEMGGFRFPTTIPWEGKSVTLDLVPDHAFGLTFKNGKRLTCFTEVDSNSEPSRTTNVHRKSLWRNALQYEQFVGRKLYQKHIDGGAVVMNFFTNKNRMHNAIRMIEKEMGGSNYMLFKHVPNFDKVNFVVPKRVLYEIYDESFLRPGREQFTLSAL